MAHLDPEVREATDALDSLGNTTAAVAKGFAIASAAVTSLALFSAFTKAVELERIDISRVPTMIGLLLGAMFPFLFAALTMNAVGRAASLMIEEVRRQFREIPGLKAGDPEAKADYNKCIDIATTSALQQMILPGSLAIALPLVVGFIDVEALGGLLGGALVTGFLWRSSCPTLVVLGTTPRNSSRPVRLGAKEVTLTLPLSSATRWVTLSRTPRARR